MLSNNRMKLPSAPGDRSALAAYPHWFCGQGKITTGDDVSPKEGLAFVKRHGVVLHAARGPVPSLAEAIAGGPIRGSWWEDYDVLEWGEGWEPVAGHDNSLQAQLQRELGQSHPVAAAKPLVFGRCRSCDDIVAALGHIPGEPELAVIYLTWGSRPRVSPADGPSWPYFERVTTAELIRRFLRGGDPL